MTTLHYESSINKILACGRWDAASGASRVDFHGGATSSYRMMKSDGRVQSAQIRVDRTAETDVRRCVVSAPRRVSLAERALPALPDLQAFSFAGDCP